VTATRAIVSVLYAEATAPVVAAQTLPLLAAMRDRGERVDAVIFASPRRLFVPGDFVAHRRAFGSFTATIGRPPAVLTHRPRAQSFARLGRRMAKELTERGTADAILICRQPRATLAACAARDVVRAAGVRAPFVVHDQRGIRPEEYLMSLGREESELSSTEVRMLATYRDHEHQACVAADAVLCVSHAMVRHVRESHGVAEERVLRLPNLARPVDDAEQLRAAARKRLRLDDDALVLAYSGTLAAWQLPEATALFAAAVANLRPGTRLLMVTPDVAVARAAARAAAVVKPIIRSATPDRAHELVAAAEYGLLLRDDSEVNRVSCPVKFGEYLACGVRPVLTPTVGDQSDLCMSTNLGVVVPLTDAGTAARRLLVDLRTPFALGAEARAKRRAWATENISPTCTAAKLLELLTPLHE
jgi:hypothetical protein